MGWTIPTRELLRQIAAEVSATTRYYDQVIQWLPHASDRGELLDQIECPQRSVVEEEEAFPDLSGDGERRSAVLLYANFNYDYDIQRILMELRPRLARSSRVLSVSYNPYLRWVFALAHRLGLRRAEPPTTFVTRSVLMTIAKLAGFEVVRERPAAFFPFRLLGLGTLLDRIVSGLPLVRNLACVEIAYLRPLAAPTEPPSLSIVVPARNERGNIEAALERLPAFDAPRVEVLFVEGHSSDGTWEEIQRVVADNRRPIECRALQQKGVGKADAVRAGFAAASGDLLTILDADLTMPPELLPRFYDAWCRGDADFVNGSRLVYPMEGGAMRSLNLLGNLFFAKSLSWILETRLTDVLCGTKLLSRADYERFCRWREDFGDVDPFGDFELLFPAAVLGLGIVDIPIRYRDRTFGSTQIRRFRHGLDLLRMTLVGYVRIKIARR